MCINAYLWSICVHALIWNYKCKCLRIIMNQENKNEKQPIFPLTCVSLPCFQKIKSVSKNWTQKWNFSIRVYTACSFASDNFFLWLPACQNLERGCHASAHTFFSALLPFQQCTRMIIWTHMGIRLFFQK